MALQKRKRVGSKSRVNVERLYSLDSLESRLFLSAVRAAPRSVAPRSAPVPADVVEVAPRVSGVYVSSTDWSQAFKDQLAAAGYGSSQYGYAIPGANAQKALGWRGLNQVSIQFTQDVSIVKDDLVIKGVKVPAYAIGSFSYNSTTRTATWTLQAGQRFTADKVRLELNGQGPTIYDAKGFESPQFTLTQLEGSDPANGPWQHSSAGGSAVVKSGISSGGGAQAVEVRRGVLDERWGVRKPVAAPSGPVSIKWDAYVTHTNLPATSFGPFFGLEAYDDLGNAPRLAGSLGVDAATGEILYQDGLAGGVFVAGPVVSFDAWHSFEMVLDYGTDTYTVKVDAGGPNQFVLAGVKFVDAGVDDFTDAPIAALAAGGDPTSQKANGLAYFDNLQVMNGASSVYNAAGFESPRFTPANLEGSDAAQGPWVYSGDAGSADIQNAISKTPGSQAVKVERGVLDERWGVRKPVAAPSAPVSVKWDAYVTHTNLPGGSFGPFFGVEAYDDLGNAPRLAGSLGVDAATGEILYQDGSAGGVLVAGPVVSFDAWHSFEMVLDYGTDTYTVKVDAGTAGEFVLSGIHFVDAGVDDFTDAPIAALAAGGDPTSQNARGVAYFDNYRVGLKPAPVNTGGTELDGEWASQTVNVDLNSGFNPTNTYAGQGAFVTSDAHQWNGLVLGSGVQSGTLVASDGSATPVTVTVAFDGAYDIDSQGGAPQSSFVGARALLDDFVYSAGGAKAFSINHLTPGRSYDLYLYSAPGGAGPRNASFTIGSTTKSVTGANLDSFSQGGNYVVFTNVVADAGGQVSGTYFGTGEADFNGLQIVSSFPSGDGNPGGAFAFNFNVLEGDFTGDGNVDFSDLTVLAQHYNMPSFMPAEGDATADGVTDFQDLVVLAQNYNTSLPAGSPAASLAAALASAIPVAPSATFSRTNSLTRKETPFSPSKAPVYQSAGATSAPARAAAPLKGRTAAAPKPASASPVVPTVFSITTIRNTPAKRSPLFA